ncbi:MAG TPA: PQQ-dependent sugar dehydrogenase [Aggregatilineales bacterium]|nr:PQQ-dependent sugar dehydrogenase [Aggregatilineales bacterium]
MIRRTFIVFLLAALAYLGIYAYQNRDLRQTANENYEWVRIASVPLRPVYITHAGDDRLFIVEQPGRIRILQDGAVLDTPFLDIQNLVNDSGNEEGLLSVAFDPDYATNGFFYVNYTSPARDTRIVRFQVSDDVNIANPDSAEIILSIQQPFPNHNGGQLHFGRDGYLYIGMGDGGSGGDPQGHGQNLETLLGAILRIDVRQPPYIVPPDIPFVNEASAQPEIWSYGFRNPWRFSFDRVTHDLWIADVGQNNYEEINFQPASSGGGENYGWNLFEGTHDFQNAPDDHSGFVFPVMEYSHDNGCSVSGGYVYRGTVLPELQGHYFYGDYCTGKIWTLVRSGDDWINSLFLDSSFRISSFGEDANGELYLANFNDSGIYKLVARTTP